MQNMKTAKKSDTTTTSILKTLNSPIAAHDLLEALRGQGIKAQPADDGVRVPDRDYGAASSILMRMESGEAIDPLFDADGSAVEEPGIAKGTVRIVPEYIDADGQWAPAEGCLHDCVPGIMDDRRAIAAAAGMLATAIRAHAKANPSLYAGLSYCDLMVRRRDGDDDCARSVSLARIARGGRKEDLPPLKARDLLIALSVLRGGDWDAIYSDIKKGRPIDREEAAAAVARAETAGLAATTLVDEDYPAVLKLSSRPPFVIYSDDGGEALRALSGITHPTVVYVPSPRPCGHLGGYGQDAEILGSGSGRLELAVRKGGLIAFSAGISTVPCGGPQPLGEAHRLAVQLASDFGVVARCEHPDGEDGLNAAMDEALRGGLPGIGFEIVARATDDGRSWNAAALRSGRARIWIDESDIAAAVRRSAGIAGEGE